MKIRCWINSAIFIKISKLKNILYIPLYIERVSQWSTRLMIPNSIPFSLRAFSCVHFESQLTVSCLLLSRPVPSIYVPCPMDYQRKTGNGKRFMDAHSKNVESSRKRPLSGNRSPKSGRALWQAHVRNLFWVGGCLWIGLLPCLPLVKHLSQFFQSSRASELVLKIP